MSNSAENEPKCPDCTCIMGDISTNINNNEDNDCSLHAEFNDFSQICKFTIKIQVFEYHLQGSKLYKVRFIPAFWAF